jgi:hypothetical protein
VAQAQIQDNLDVKKVLAPSKIPAKWLIMCFSRLKNIKSLTSKNSGTLIVNLIFADFMYYIALLKNHRGAGAQHVGRWKIREYA